MSHLTRQSNLEEAGTFLTCIREVLGLNLARVTDYPENVVVIFSTSEKFWDSTLKLSTVTIPFNEKAYVGLEVLTEVVMNSSIL
jgi:hypothetical protein